MLPGKVLGITLYSSLLHMHNSIIRESAGNNRTTYRFKLSNDATIFCDQVPLLRITLQGSGNA